MTLSSSSASTSYSPVCERRFRDIRHGLHHKDSTIGLVAYPSLLTIYRGGGMPSWAQILRAVVLSISVWRGTLVRLPVRVFW